MMSNFPLAKGKLNLSTFVKRVNFNLGVKQNFFFVLKTTLLIKKNSLFTSKYFVRGVKHAECEDISFSSRDPRAFFLQKVVLP
jgi:hypothetical protein